VSGSAQGNLLAVPTKQGVQAGLEGTLKNGRSISGLP
jgi:hypothetical protein